MVFEKIPNTASFIIIQIIPISVDIDGTTKIELVGYVKEYHIWDTLEYYGTNFTRVHLHISLPLTLSCPPDHNLRPHPSSTSPSPLPTQHSTPVQQPLSLRSSAQKPLIQLIPTDTSQPPSPAGQKIPGSQKLKTRKATGKKKGKRKRETHKVKRAALSLLSDVRAYLREVGHVGR